ncbi:MAG: AmmeMemoRadiSam system protein B [Dehalococcoidia bacterium]|nr:AmmeMemoRadiSam system protein B [Dehalococcoidia bacterium]
MRKPVVAGSFYAGSSAGLQRQIEDCFKHPLGPGTLPGAGRSTERHTLGLVSPHAGYIYSGPVAANGFLRLAAERTPKTVVIVGPNHRGLGAAVAVGREGTWQTPLGTVEVDAALGETIVSGGHWAKWDDLAHSMEHSLEVQVPFLQYIYGSEFKILPIAMLRQELEIAQDLGRAIAAALKGKEGVIIASSDFSHYESQASASKKDRMALEAILALEPARLEETVTSYNITMCGPGPVMAMITSCVALGARKASLLRYGTSGDITGDYSQVVGYASVAVSV